MPRTRQPRKGSMQYWPRKRASRSYARLRRQTKQKDVKLAGFAGYKVGMTHLMIVENRPNSPMKGQPVVMPATIIECPPIKVFGINAYKKTPYGLALSFTVSSTTNDKELARRIRLPKKSKQAVDGLKADELDHIRLLVYTQPKLTGIGKKKPELFELPVGGKVAEQIEYAKGVLGKEIKVSDVFSEGSQIDMHAVTKGHGIQGPVHRFGVKIRFHKSEKTKRGPGTLGPWHGAKTHRVAHAGQTGYHLRTEYNKWIVKLDTDANKVNPNGGWIRYGLVKNEYILLKGSIPGASKRLITMTTAMRPSKKIPAQAPKIQYISKESRQ